MAEEPLSVWERLLPYAWAFFGVSLLVGIALSGGLYYSIVFWEDWRYTVYADGYAQKAFDQIQIGDSVATVRGRVGDPLNSWEEESVRIEEYSESTIHGSYWRKWLIIDPETERVVKKYDHFYWD